MRVWIGIIVVAAAGLATCGCGGTPQARGLEARAPEVAATGEAAWPRAEPLPEAAPEGWEAAGPAREYTPETLFEHIDGGAEFYLRYGFRRGLVREYEGEVGRAVVELYEMGSTADAYGAFHWELPRDRPALGAAAAWEGGVVKVWTDRYLLRVSAEREEEEGTRAAILGLAREVLAGLPAGGEAPELVRRAQAEGMEEDSLRYFHEVETLNSIVFREAWSRLGLTSDTEAVWGESAGGEEALVVRYATAEVASAAGEAVREALAEEGAAKFAVAAEGGVVVVLGAESPAAAQAEAERLAAAF